MVRGGMQFIKYLLFFFNFCFVIIGSVLIGLGVSTKAGWNEKYFAFIKISDFTTPPNLLIGVGVLIFVISFLGCCGAVKENHCMMMSYSVLVGLILVLELGAAFAAFALKDDAVDLLGKGLVNSQQQYGSHATELAEETTKNWDVLQHTLQCCGTHNFTDWNDYVHKNNASLPIIPESCCIEDTLGCSKSVNTTTPWDVAKKIIYVDGCLQKAIDDFAVGTLGIVALVLAGIELLGVICACFLARSIRYSYETV